MHIAFIAVSVLLALEMAVTGAPKVLQLSISRTSAEHLGVSVALDRAIGTAEMAAAVGLVLGIAYPALALVAGAAVCLLMFGAIGYHVKAKDNVPAVAPALFTAALALAVVVLAVEAAPIPNL